ncbi:MAG: pyruvate ferredoxin oxidoreductase, partial [Peptococcaceae bacterium]|nr:pyruvate ferredoxin oxidoreductase [Peptococcaceae bacterium]
AGLLKIRLFRPFPEEEIAQALKSARVIACMDRTESFSGHCGPLGAEVKSALLNARLMPEVINYVYGIGGRDVAVENIISVFEDLIEIDQTKNAGARYRYLSVRE